MSWMPRLKIFQNYHIYFQAKSTLKNFQKDAFQAKIGVCVQQESPTRQKVQFLWLFLNESRGWLVGCSDGRYCLFLLCDSFLSTSFGSAFLLRLLNLHFRTECITIGLRQPGGLKYQTLLTIAHSTHRGLRPVDEMNYGELQHYSA